jgi:FMN-dependent NADH-azoreductase
MKLLHIVATPRDQHSNTLRVSSAFLERLHTLYPDLQVSITNLFDEDLPKVSGENIESKYTLMMGQPIDKAHAESWRNIEALINQFLSADVYLISTPMWNFSIPYTLKYYIDALVQPGYLFKFTAEGVPVGLIQGKSMVCITSRGGDYGPASPAHGYDFQEPYLRAVFGYCGITDIQFIHAQPMDITPELRETALGTAIEAAHSLADGWKTRSFQTP